MALSGPVHSVTPTLEEAIKIITSTGPEPTRDCSVLGPALDTILAASRDVELRAFLTRSNIVSHIVPIYTQRVAGNDGKDHILQSMRCIGNLVADNGR